MEDKKEGGLPIGVLIVVIGISAIIVFSFIPTTIHMIFSR